MKSVVSLVTTPDELSTEAEAPTSDNLELELRHLPGVDYVGLARQASLLRIEIGTDGTIPSTVVADEAMRVAEGWLDSDVDVRIVDGDVTSGADMGAPSSLRVQLLAAVDGRGRPDADERIEIHLAHLGRRSVAHAAEREPVQVAEAALAGLRQLGFPVPFEVETVHLLPDELGAGVLVVLVDGVSGERRRGIATGRSLGETISRAVLNGLNRYLQTIERRTDD